MDKKTEPFFPHRRIQDGNLQSICLTCLRTVGVSKLEEELNELDRAHRCKAVPYSARVPRPNRSGNRPD
ncbi:hypothetical protein HDF08_003276 [Edaphobacter lichenicola]|uniref:Uncharacterized protein n=1 Tax=Tunturiibacter lichenicola TaxID=2051959 RepID=A0A852VL78_9BACT|nr:hypothetical protein [Edaphobacter lichenicola]